MAVQNSELQFAEYSSQSILHKPCNGSGSSTCYFRCSVGDMIVVMATGPNGAMVRGDCETAHAQCTIPTTVALPNQCYDVSRTPANMNGIGTCTGTGTISFMCRATP